MEITMADLHINNKGWEFAWSNFEDQIIREYYPKNGYQKVLELLPNRNKKGIQSRASKSKVRYLSYNKNYFDTIDTQTKAYWLGFLYADGYVTTDNRWGLEIQLSDIQHMKNLLSEIECNINIKTRKRETAESCLFQINNKHMHETLIKSGVCMNKSSDLKFPEPCILDKKYYSDFIRGFFDGDGSISYSKEDYVRKDRGNRTFNNLRKSISFVCNSDSFIKDILAILKDHDINFHYYLNKTHNNLPTIQTGSSDNVIKFRNYIYANSTPFNRLERKYTKFENLLNEIGGDDYANKSA